MTPEVHNTKLKKLSIFAMVFSFLLMIHFASFAATRTWTGNTNSDWTLASNWGGTVPVAGDDVLIPGGRPNYPVIATNVSVRTINVNNTGTGATLTLAAGGNLTINAGANFVLVTAGGTLIQNGGTVFITGKIPTIAGTFSQTAGTYTSDQNLILTGTLNQSGGLIHLAINTSTNPTDNLTITGGTVNQSGGTIYTKDYAPTTGTFNQTGSGAVFRIFHDWKPTSAHIFNATDGTVQFSGAPANSNFVSPNVQFYNILIDVDPVFGKVNNSTIKIRGNFTNNVTANLVVTASTYFRFNGTSSQTITSAAGTNLTFSNLEISNPAATVSLASNINMNGGLLVRDRSTFNLSTYSLGANTRPTSVTLECGTVTGSSITGSGTLTLGGNLSVNSDGTGNDGATVSANIALAANRIFTVADDGTSAADLTVSGIISGAFSLTKEGAGRLVLSGSNSYTGSTTITTGRLTLGAAGVIPDGSGIILNGGTLRTGNTTGFNETTGTLTLNTTSTLELGSGTHSLRFAASSGVAWPGTSTISVNGWTGGFNGTTGTAGKIYVGTSAAGLTAAQLNRINFFDGTGYYIATILPDGEVVPSSTPYAPANLSYKSPNYFQVGTAITPLSPTVSGFVQSYSIDPALPAGLTLNTSTGVISGIPTAISDLNSYLIIASNISGSSQFDIAIAVGTTIISAATGSWSTPTTWTGGVVPQLWDNVGIRNGRNVSVDIEDAGCYSLLIGSSADGIANLSFSGSNPSLQVVGNINVGDPADKDRPGIITFTGDATLIAGSLTLNRALNGVTLSTINMTAGGVLQTGSLVVAGLGAAGDAIWTPGAGTVIMTATNTLPTAIITSFNNLEISSGTTTTGVALPTIKGSLTVNGSTTFSLAHNVGATAGPALTSLQWGISGSTISGAGTLTLGGNVYVSYVAGASNTASISAPVALGGTRTFTVEGDGVSINTGLTVNSIISGTSGLTKEGAGTIMLSGSNTYTGLTTISEGTLRLGAAGAGANSPLGTVDAGTTVTSGAALSLNGYTLTTAEALTLNGTGISEGGALTNISSTAASYSGLITLGSQSSIIATQGDINITNTGTITGATFNLTLGGSANGTMTSIIGTTSGALIKTGTGIWTLLGANTNTGGTTITAGILSLGAANRLSDAGTMTLNGGTFSTGATTGYNEAVSTLNLSDNSVISLGAGAHTLTFAASNGMTWTSGKTLTIIGWTGNWNGTSGTSGRIFAGNSAAGLTAEQLGQIQFYDGTSYFPATILISGEVCPGYKTITTGSISGSPFCAGTSVSVPYTINGTFLAGNIFTAQLSDASGSFASPVNIGTLASIFGGTITATIPAGTLTGIGYRIRVVSDSPVVTGTDNGSNFAINALLPVSVSIAPSSNPVCSNESVTFTATPVNGGAAPSYQWRLNGTDVGTNSNTYINPAPVNGDVVICILTSNATCPTGSPATSNTITMSVTTLPVATFSYTGTSYYQMASDPLPTFSGGGVAGTFSAVPAGLVFISTATGQVDLSASTPGTYTVTNTIAAAGACGIVTESSDITIVADLHWTGAVNTNWNLPGNWTSGVLPDITTDVHIPDVPNKPVLSTGASGAVNNITIDINSSLTVTGNILQIAGTITNDGTFTVTVGTIEMKGSSAQSIAADLFAGNTLNNLIINNAAGVTLQGPLSITGIVTPLSGNLLSNGNLLLVSTAGETALIAGSGTGTVTGNVTMQRYLARGFGYKYFSSPFQAATVNEFADDMNLAAAFPPVYRYDESLVSSGWVNYSNAANPLITLAGYAVNMGSSAAPRTIDMTGLVNNGSLSITLNNNNNTYTKGFNLAGNPYPSPVDWDLVNKSSVDDAIYYFRASSTDQYGGSYSSYVGGISSDGAATNVIPSMQGFFVHVSDGAYPVSGSLSMDNSDRITDLTHSFMKSDGKGLLFLIRLGALFTNNPVLSDPTVVYFNDKALAGFDSNFDALKLINTDPDSPNLYSLIAGGTRLSINALPEIYDDNISMVPLGLFLYKAGEISFSCKSVENLPTGMGIYLHDAITGISQDLLHDKDYKINLAGGEYSNRFSLKLVKNATDIPDINPQPEFFRAWSFKGHIKANISYINGNEGIINIFDISGRKVFVQEVYEEGYLEFDPQLNAGIYIINYISGKVIETKKIVIANK